MAQRSFAAKLVSWIVTLVILIPLALIAVLFALSNREWVDVAFWPLPGTVEIPLYLMSLPGIPIGFVLGGLLVWSTKRIYKVRAARAERRAEDLDRELSVMRIREEELRARAAIKGETPAGLLEVGR